MNAEAAIVNYYRPGDTMGGHVDDAETDRSLPLVSVSLGCSAVFLVGGATRDVRRGTGCHRAGVPVAARRGVGRVVISLGRRVRLRRRSGGYYHGVPRILPDTCRRTYEKRRPGQRLAPAMGDNSDEAYAAGRPADDGGAAALRFLRGSRLNLNVREVGD